MCGGSITEMKQKRRAKINDVKTLREAKRRKKVADDYLKWWYEFDALEDKMSLEAKRIDVISSNLLHEWIGLYKRTDECREKQKQSMNAT